MGQTLTSLNYHLIFATKNREPLLHHDIRPRLHEYMGGIIRQLNGVSRCVGGTADHLHIACSLPPSQSVSDALRTIKANSSRWIRSLSPKFSKFAWQSGYSAFTVSQSQLEVVIRYICDQEEHHRKMTFREELLGFYRKHGIEFDERYLWE
ncbi:MAG: IS200/IS605 family transposase [candidate division Zixibacteria bacterium]|nr:IS200/IS605 family transposase [candidate division Zixibacteria bacterium]